jgi:hypothetical protein
MQQRNKITNFRSWWDNGSNADVRARKYSRHSETGYQNGNKMQSIPCPDHERQ